MLSFLVLAKVDLPLKGFVTEPAREGLVTRVFPHVGDEVRGLTEGFRADDAFVGLLA